LEADVGKLREMMTMDKGNGRAPIAADNACRAATSALVTRAENGSNDSTY
jgi:hypothetical protein